MQMQFSPVNLCVTSVTRTVSPNFHHTAPQADRTELILDSLFSHGKICVTVVPDFG